MSPCPVSQGVFKSNNRFCIWILRAVRKVRLNLGYFIKVESIDCHRSRAIDSRVTASKFWHWLDHAVPFWAVHFHVAIVHTKCLWLPGLTNRTPLPCAHRSFSQSVSGRERMLQANENHCESTHCQSVDQQERNETQTQKKVRVFLTLKLDEKFNLKYIFYNTSYLRCRNIEFGCHGTALIRRANLDELIERQPHYPSCPPSPEAVEVIRFKDALRTSARIHHREPRAIYDSLALIYPETAVLVPFHQIRGTLKKWRSSAFPASPTSLDRLAHQIENPLNVDLFVHQQGTVSTRILRDSDDCRHFAFYDAELINRIAPNVNTIMIDFTYKTCIEIPNENMQLGTVMAIYHGHALPIMWFLLSRKTTNCYRTMAAVVQEVLARAEIRTIVTDFELALRTALRENYPNAFMIGCFFHFVRVS
ncbi:unnamed protein product [Trichogramma brassicae]|uniref:MULE transposase domain-containing protein n=1 Tax=Trichogramma brassicae TaxID=86971 RepID=A0A6H5IC49_9HYME|nr:unnamed protein product [Trichogramma brassicae]